VNKKYFPFLALLAAILLFFWVKKNQRGHVKKEVTTVTTEAKTTEQIDRSSTHLVYSKHARCRMDCRHIDESEVKEILEKGEINYDKIEDSDKGRSYPLEGVTKDKQHVRIVFAPHGNEIVVVTVIDLDKEWQCDCN
jgi:acetylornithine deacetylase/succinyl-diaminopimelate desuccinylase-like protein